MYYILVGKFYVFRILSVQKFLFISPSYLHSYTLKKNISTGSNNIHEIENKHYLRFNECFPVCLVGNYLANKSYHFGKYDPGKRSKIQFIF